jgi:hypothetical protein
MSEESSTCFVASSRTPSTTTRLLNQLFLSFTSTPVNECRYHDADGAYKYEGYILQFPKIRSTAFNTSSNPIPAITTTNISQRVVFG